MKGKDIIKKLKSASADDIKKEIATYRDRLWTLRTDLASGKVKNVAEIKRVKRDIARLMTLLNSQ